MELYKELNRELTTKNQELRQLVHTHRMESFALSKKLMEERESFEQMKKSIIGEITNCFHSLVKVLYPGQSDKLLLSNSQNSDTSGNNENKENNSKTSTVVREPLTEVDMTNITRRRGPRSYQYGNQSGSTETVLEERSSENLLTNKDSLVDSENYSNGQLSIISEESTLVSNSTLTSQHRSQDKPKIAINSVICVGDFSSESILEEQSMNFTKRISSDMITRKSPKINKIFESKLNGSEQSKISLKNTQVETLTSNYLSLSETGYNDFTMSKATSSTPRKSLSYDGEVDKSLKNVKVVLTRLDIDKFMNSKNNASVDYKCTVKKTEDEDSPDNLDENRRRTRRKLIKEESIEYSLETTDSSNFKRPKRRAATLIKSLAEPSGRMKLRRDT